MMIIHWLIAHARGRRNGGITSSSEIQSECGSDFVSRCSKYNFIEHLLHLHDNQTMANDRLPSTVLVLAALFGLAFAHPEVSRSREADTLLKERGTCFYDDTLLSFQYWRLDSEPYCSSLLGVQDFTSTLPSATSRR